MLDMKQLEEISRLLLKANKIYIFGIGTSSVIATDAQYRFTQFGLQATAYTDMLFMNVAAANMKPDDVALCISHGGRSKAVVDAMRRAKCAGAITVAITSFSGSILAKESDYTVCVFSDEENYPVEAVSARVAHLCLIDAFMMTIATLNYDQFSKHIANRNQILNEIRY
jgi:DNA-binding MurR/RpiR family transcriptional regulator